MDDYWYERAMPVLDALRDHVAPYGSAGVLMVGPDRDNELGLDLSGDVIQETLLQLHDAAYVEWNDVSYYGGGGAAFVGVKVSGRGMQVLGEWPRFEAMVSPATLAELVDRLAGYASGDDAEQMRRAAGVIRCLAASGLKSVALGASAQLLRSSLGLP